MKRYLPIIPVLAVMIGFGAGNAPEAASQSAPLVRQAVAEPHMSGIYGGWSVVLYKNRRCTMPEVVEVVPNAREGVYGANIHLCGWVDGEHVFAVTEGGTKMVIPRAEFIE
jgi:hypothetical protein